MSAPDRLLPFCCRIDRVQRQRHLDQLLAIVRHSAPRLAPTCLFAPLAPMPVIVQPSSPAMSGLPAGRWPERRTAAPGSPPCRGFPRVPTTFSGLSVERPRPVARARPGGLRRIGPSLAQAGRCTTPDEASGPSSVLCPVERWKLYMLVRVGIKASGR